MAPSMIFTMDYRTGEVRCQICDNEVDVDPNVDEECPMCGTLNEVKGKRE